MAGLIGVGRNTLGQASVGFQQSAGLEANRNAAQQQLNAARAAQRSSMVATGAGLGGSIGVNNYMAAKAAAAKAGTGAATTAAPPVAVLSAPADLATSVGTQLGSVPVPVSEITGTGINSLASTAPELLLAEATSTAVPTVALEAAVPAAGELAGTLGAITAPTSGIAAGTTAATTAGTSAVAGGASTGALAGIGAIATPLLIGAGAALLLDSLFDIF
jgi:hypothetical protein